MRTRACHFRRSLNGLGFGVALSCAASIAIAACYYSFTVPCTALIGIQDPDPDGCTDHFVSWDFTTDVNSPASGPGRISWSGTTCSANI